MQASSTRTTLVCASSEDSRVCAVSRVCASVLLDVVYIPQTRNYGSMNGGIFDEISSFIAYAQSIYSTCMRDCARLPDGRHRVSGETRSLHFCMSLCLPHFYDPRAANGLVRLCLCTGSSEL